MVFSSMDFLFKFLPVFLTVYYISPDRYRNVCLFAGSLIFYLHGVRDNVLYLGLLVLSILVNYRLGVWIGRRRRGRRWDGFRRRWLISGIVYNLLWLFLFKYAAFFAGNINALLQRTGCGYAIPVMGAALPVGISFYTFQAVSYLVDVYRGNVGFEPSFIGFGMYICMFPQLIAGPIVTYSSISRQITKRRHTFGKIEDGLREFTIGLGLKVLLANQIGRLWNEVGAIGYESISTPLAWLGLAAFSLQIYFDFYGYSLMAKGLGRLMGFQLPDNFDHPYMALSMTDFWRRWHMTLGSWFREYVYIPLGGNRAGKLQTLKNMFIVWFLTGFWHGASWNFIIWGVVLFVLIAVEKAGLYRLLARWPAVGHLYMMFAIPLTWLVFAVTDLRKMAVYILRLFPVLDFGQQFAYYEGDFMKYGKIYGISMLAGLVFMTGMPRRIYDRYKYRHSFISTAILLTVFWLCVYCMKMGADDPFLYFRF